MRAAMRRILDNRIGLSWTFVLILFVSSYGVIYAQKINSETPGQRWGHTFIYFPDQEHILFFGGKSQQGGPFLDDTWIWNGKWQKIDVTGPTSRGFSAAAYHEKRKSIIVHGGRGNNRESYSDTWEWDGFSWVLLQDTCSYGVDHHKMVYLKQDSSILAYGGWNGNNVTGDTWIWNGKWRKMSYSSPPKRAAFGMAYRPSSNTVILYGGLWINGQYADIWEWQNHQWKALSGPYDNSSLDHHSMIYDTKANIVLGFGGKNYKSIVQNNTFTLKDDRIVVLSRQGPPERHSFGYTYSTKDKRCYVYGGKVYKNGQQIALSDFWEWNGESWITVR